MLTEFFSDKGSGADIVVNLATVELRFGTVVTIEKLMFNVAYKRIGVAGSHFGTPLICLDLFRLGSHQCN